jgi:hypothetical protein
VSLTRRKLFGWVAALFGGVAVAKVAPAEAAPDEVWSRYDAATGFEPKRGYPPSYFGHDPAYPGMIGHWRERMEARAKRHEAKPGALTRPEQIANSLGWTFRKYEGDA